MTMTETRPDTDEATEPFTATVLVDDFRRVLHNAVVFAGKDNKRPVLTCVNLVFNADNTLTAIATDSYMIGLDTCDYDGTTPSPRDVADHDPSDSLSFMASRSEIEQLLKAIAKLAAIAPAALRIEGDTLTVAYAGGTVELTRAIGQFPNWRQLVPSSTAPTERIAWNPQFLAKLAKVKTASGINEPAVFTLQGELKPTKIQVGDTFIGLLMPARIPELTEKRS